jgi:predicted nucleic acid-binding protein
MIVVDASVAAKWILEEEHSDKAQALYSAHTRAGERIVAPPLLNSEITNVLRQQMRREGLSLADATTLMRQFWSLAVTLRVPSGLHEQALALADRFNLPAAYDAHYLALAQALGCDLWTADQRLVNTVSGKLPVVRWIGDY